MVLPSQMVLPEEFVAPFAELLSRKGGMPNPRASAISFIGAVQGIAMQGMLREGGEVTLRELAEGFMEILNKPGGAR